jgi:hypothetical protein
MSDRDRPRVDLASTDVDHEPMGASAGTANKGPRGVDDLAATTKHARSYPLKPEAPIAELPDKPAPRKAARTARGTAERGPAPLPPATSDVVLKWTLIGLVVAIVVIAIALFVALGTSL